MMLDELDKAAKLASKPFTDKILFQGAFRMGAMHVLHEVTPLIQEARFFLGSLYVNSPDDFKHIHERIEAFLEKYAEDVK